MLDRLVSGVADRHESQYSVAGGDAGETDDGVVGSAQPSDAGVTTNFKDRIESRSIRSEVVTFVNLLSASRTSSVVAASWLLAVLLREGA